MSVVKDICDNLQKMPDNIIRDTNDRVKQFPKFRIVKLRIPNFGRDRIYPIGNGGLV